MKPELLHPKIVHLPLGIAMVLPILALVAIWLHFRRHDSSAAFARFWFALVVCLVAAAVGVFWAHETGEASEHAIGKSLPEAAIELHEDYAKIFSIFIYAATTVVVLGFFVHGRLKGYVIVATAILVAAALYAAVLTGNAGGDLVYKHKAANYLVPEGISTAPTLSSSPDSARSRDRKRLAD